MSSGSLTRVWRLWPGPHAQTNNFGSLNTQRYFCPLPLENPGPGIASTHLIFCCPLRDCGAFRRYVSFHYPSEGPADV